MLLTPDDKPYLTPTEVAQRMKVSPITVRAWAAKGMLVAEATPGGHRRFRREEVERFIRHSKAGLEQPLRILLVDEDPALAPYLLELLAGGSAPAQLETAFDSFEAGLKLPVFEPHIVLLDCHMRGLDGADICRRMLAGAGHPAPRVIGMAGVLAPELEAAMLAAGAESCFSKPPDAGRLLAALGLAP